MRKLAALLCLLLLASCSSGKRDAKTLVFLIDSSPANLDPRIGTDGQSEHIDELIFDGLVSRDANFNFTPALAERWEEPDPRTVIFHLRSGVLFHNGQPLTARDVVWSVESMRNGTVISAKAASYASVESIEARDPLTVVFHLRQPDNFLLTNLSTSAMGIIPYGSGKDFWRHPIGTGPFKFVSAQADQNVILERNADNWQHAPSIERVRFAIVPDAITESLELEKGSADIAMNSLPMDSLPLLAKRPNLVVQDGRGTPLQYLGFNLRDPILRDGRVRQAIACAVDRGLIIRALLRGHAQPAASMLPESHWAWTGDTARYDYEPKRAMQLLDAAGYRAGADGVRFHLTMKTSTAEDSRLLAAVLQQQLGRVGIALDLRSFEFATFYSDVTRGAFQIYSMRWVGGNEQPDIFSYVFSSARFSPKGANRSHYANAQVDKLLDDAAASSDQLHRRADYIAVQKQLAEDLPAFNLWYLDNVVVHNRRLTHVDPAASGNYRFLQWAELEP